MIPSLLTYNICDKVYAFSTERYNGFSKGAYASFNANEFCGDDAKAVEQNRLLLCNYLHIDPSNLVIPHQTHGIVCACIDNDFFSKDKEQRNLALAGVDALITNVPRVCVAVSTADCIPILLYDVRNSAVAAVHAGWRGTLYKISTAVLYEMRRKYGTNPKYVRAIIGPGISIAAFEVGKEVFDAYKDKGFSIETIAKFYGKTGKWHIDLFKCNRMTLESGGVLPFNITEAGVCTYFCSERFFSARRLGAKCGRILNGIFIK